MWLPLCVSTPRPRHAGGCSLDTNPSLVQETCRFGTHHIAFQWLQSHSGIPVNVGAARIAEAAHSHLTLLNGPWDPLQLVADLHHILSLGHQEAFEMRPNFPLRGLITRRDASLLVRMPTGRIRKAVSLLPTRTNTIAHVQIAASQKTS